jgi:tRNA dimethylallyltransferase
MSTSSLPVIILMGPTAIGKTDLAIELVQHLPLEIISVDSAMIYRGMDIGTGKPSAEIQAVAPHHLIDICDPKDTYSVAQFCRDAHEKIIDIHQRNKIPLLVGGTMLYFHGLIYGLSNLPSADLEIRKKLELEAREHGWEYLHQKLSLYDPISAAKIHPNDPQRLQRALEIYYLMGKPMSEIKEASLKSPLNFPLTILGLLPEDRHNLHQRIEQRFNHMLEEGLIDEVQKLWDRKDLNKELPSIRAVGYRQAWEYLNNSIDYPTMKEKAIIATRQLAKRQMTWMRRWENLKVYHTSSNDLLLLMHSIKNICRI